MTRKPSAKRALLLIVVMVAATVGFAGPVWASPGTAITPNPVPTTKALDPPTDLKDYPKLPAPSVDPAQWGTPSRGNEVIATTTAPDGSGHATIYTPVPGESAEVLYSLLKAQGVSGLQNPADPPAPRDVIPYTANSLKSCVYGSAYTFRCGTDSTLSHQIRWADGCCAHPQVWIVDHTPSQWPVSTSTYVWNGAHGVDSLYKFQTCPGYSGQHCVDVRDVDAVCSGWQGLTNVTYNSSTYYLLSASIQLNDYNGTCQVGNITYNYAKNSAGYRQDACHEIGHALGMGHNVFLNSCMFDTILNSPTALTPNSDDYTLIAQLYNDGNE
jgi:hypothetical protein